MLCYMTESEADSQQGRWLNGSTHSRRNLKATSLKKKHGNLSLAHNFKWCALLARKIVLQTSQNFGFFGSISAGTERSLFTWEVGIKK